MAADPLCALLLLGMGLEEFSMGSLYIPVDQESAARDYLSGRQSRRPSWCCKWTPSARSSAILFEQMRELGMVELLEMYS